MAKILIVEDEDELRNAVRRTLEFNGYEVVTVSEGSQAIKAIQDELPDLVLTDIFMPGMEGLETIRALSSSYPDLPIVVMTGSLDPLFIDMSLRFGAVHGLNKPFSTDELLLVIEQTLSNKIEPAAAEADASPENQR